MTPKLSENNAVRYLLKLYKSSYKLFAPHIKETDSWDTAVSALHSSTTIEGLDESILFLDRINVVGAVTSLNHKSWLIENSIEIMNSDDQCYFVVSDKMLTGPESLFLCAAGIYEQGYDSVNDMFEVIKGWKLSASSPYKPFPMIITNSCILKDNTVFSIAAIQLASTQIKQKHNDQDD